MKRRTFLGAIGAAVAAFFVPEASAIEHKTTALGATALRFGRYESVRFIESVDFMPREEVAKSLWRHIEPTIIPDDVDE